MNVEYALKRSTRARTMRLVVHPDSRVVVTAPASFGLGSIERFVAKHSAWLQRKVAETAGRKVIYVRRSEVAALKHRALALASARCAYFAKQYGVQYKKITIRAPKSRWGSCSRAGNLSFNYKIAVLPSHIADYIIVHELCHLAEMNHSEKFWELVGRTVPEHKAHRKELRNTLVVFS
ncbi:MAG: SprT family zinc-dependent metalloprotease [bacterium]|nr:SprT family zinc-dependent metalloprotease [bacterium]